MDTERSNEGNSTNDNTVGSASQVKPSLSLENPKAYDMTVVPKKYEEEASVEDESQEFKDLIATLPKKSDRFETELLCQYQGFWFPKKIIEGILRFQNQFQASDSDIILVTSPKSGTTWIKALIFTIINRNTNNPTSPILTTNPHVLVPFLEVLLLHENKSSLSSFLLSLLPRILATHIPYVLLSESMKQSQCKIVYLCRNPKDIFVSLWHFMCNVVPQHLLGFHSLEDFFEEFCRGVTIFGPIWDHMLGYYKESLERPWKILFLRFEDLKNDPIRTLKQLADFIGYSFSPEEENGGVVENILKLCSFENLSSLEVNRTESGWFGIENKVYFRRGKVGDWKNLLTADMVKRFNIIIQEKLEKHGLKF
ncbi:hypothetical protein K1719_022780 [Acacia pycnantha]|nr:hypothetical protein K1719_022780 [Acacia pycnantha]